MPAERVPYYCDCPEPVDWTPQDPPPAIDGECSTCRRAIRKAAA